MKTKFNSIYIGNFRIRRERLVRGVDDHTVINEKYYTEHLEEDVLYEQQEGTVVNEMTKKLFQLTEAMENLLDASDEAEALQIWREMKLIRLITE